MPRNKRMKKQFDCPIADFLIANSKQLKANFHALPIFQLNGTCHKSKAYKQLLGNHLGIMDTTVSGRLFDSFYYPIKAIKHSQKLTAHCFGAQDSLFVTCGTTISSNIVIDALIKKTLMCY